MCVHHTCILVYKYTIFPGILQEAMCKIHYFLTYNGIYGRSLLQNEGFILASCNDDGFIFNVHKNKNAHVF